MKLVLTDVNNGYNLFAINDNFEKIEQTLQDKVLYRDNPVGEPNSMQNALDMNANRIINLPEPEAPTDPVRVQDVGKYVATNAGTSFVQDTPPTTAVSGNRWYDTSSGRTYIYYQDGDSAQWVEDNPQSGDDSVIRDDLANATDPTKGAALIGFEGETVANLLPNARKFINVLAYIPKSQHAAIFAGTSVYDASADIQAALNAASPCGEVIVPLPGKYRFNSQLTIPSGVVLKGLGSRRLWGLESNVIGVPSINVANGYYSSIRDINISHATPGSAHTAVQLIDNDGSGTGTDPAQYFEMYNVRITGHATGVRIASESTWCTFQDVIVTLCSGVAFSLTNANLTIFERCVADTCNGAWFLDGTTKTVLNNCTAQVCDSTTSAAINILNCDNVTLTNLWCERNSFHNVHVRGTSRMTRINEMLNQGAGFGTGNGRGIYVDGTSSNTIIDGGWHGGNATNDITIAAGAVNTTMIEPRSTTTISVVDNSPSSLWVSRQLRGVNGISQTTTAAKNLRGTVSIADAATTATVTFPTAEVDGAYFITLGAGASGGTPAAGSLRASWANRTGAGFTINLEAAPGAGNSVSVNWAIIR